MTHAYPVDDTRTTLGKDCQGDGMTEEGPRATTGRTLERILVVDDHKTFTDLVRMALDAEPDWAEGCLWVGLTELALYRVTGEE